MNLKSLAQATVLSLVLSTAQAQTISPAGSASLEAAGVVRWTCNAFYLPARSIWQRTVDVEFEQKLGVNGVRAVQIDGVPVYAFNIQGNTILTSIDSERVQFDSAAQTWTSDLRGIVSSQGRCERRP